MRFLSYFSLPLLSKELIEQAQSKRTYILRVIYALGLYGVTLFTYGSLVGIGSAGGLRNLGLGQVLFGQLVSVQIFMILVLLLTLDLRVKSCLLLIL